MSAPRNSGSIAGTGALILGLLFTVIGGAELIESITHRPVWDYLWRLWPVLLIIMGMKILIDHYRRVRS